MCTVDSSSVRPRQSHKTVLSTCLFYKEGVYKHNQAQDWWFFKHMLSIMLDLAKYMLSIFLDKMNFFILAITFSVKYCKTFSLWFVKNASKQMRLTWDQVVYYIIVCVTTTTQFEPTQIVWWFCCNEISNCCVFPSLSVYSNLPVY